MYRIDAQNVAMNENDLEDTEWLTTKKLRKLKEFTVTTWDKVADKDDEIVIGAEKKGKAVEIISTSALHALIVGTTGSGKTTGFVDQNIAILGRSKGKPSMIIADPKKELYEKHAKQLESEGYKISTLDLREPYSSARWNPMQVLIRRIRQVRELQFNMKQDGNKYLACGEVFQSHGDARTRVQELKDEIFENAMDLVYTLCPIQNKDQPTWEEGARNLIFGLVLAFCEDVISGKMDEKQLQLFNVCNVKIFIGSDDPDTRREFSELCGQKKVKNFSVNTSAENPASSNTGASNQPLITIGMLERLNGNEKGDAIVSVRGYEPIWSRFTPSYELKEVYFAAGKADISKREARLFDKSEYVFDILGGSRKEEEEKQLDAIERREEEQAQEEKEKMPDFAALDKAWNDKVKEVHDKILKVAQMLADEDAKALMEKSSLTVAEENDSSIAKFISLVRSYTEVNELTPEILNSFIDKIYIGKPERINGQRVQEVKIVYKLVGAVNIPQ